MVCYDSNLKSGHFEIFGFDSTLLEVRSVIFPEMSFHKGLEINTEVKRK